MNTGPPSSLTPRSRQVLTGMVFVITLWLWAPLFAIDPLPPDIEKASPEVQSAYREQLAREGVEEKIAAGKKRYNDRLRYQEKLAASLRREAQAREETIYSQIESQAASVDTTVPAPETFFSKLPLLCILGVSGYMISSKLIKGLWYGNPAPMKGRTRKTPPRSLPDASRRTVRIRRKEPTATQEPTATPR